MKERKWGRIVAVTSLSVLEPIANLAVSNAMRSAVTAMLKTLADEVAADNVTVNCVAPGMVLTDRTESLMSSRIEKSGQSRDDYMRDYLKSIPAGRLGAPGRIRCGRGILVFSTSSFHYRLDYFGRWRKAALHVLTKRKFPRESSARITQSNY